MKQAYYQISNSNAYYVSRWIPTYMRRVFVSYQFNFSGAFTRSQVVGFEQGYEYGYCLGVF
jgi:hypothetical protein